MKIKFTHAVFLGGVRIHAQDDVAELDDNTERWIRRGAAIKITEEIVDKVDESATTTAYERAVVTKRKPGRPPK